MRHFSVPCFCALLCLSLSPILLDADDTASLKGRLHTAAAASSLNTTDVKPWHLLLTFQTLDKGGKPGEAGTIEEWWAAPKSYRIVFTSPSYSNTSIVNDQGSFIRSPDVYPPEPLAIVLDQILHPLPPENEMDDSAPELRKQDFSKVPLDCIMLGQKKVGNMPYPPLGLFPTYCFDRDKSSLRLSIDSGSVVVIRNGTGNFQAKTVSTDQTVSIDGEPVVRAHVEKLTSFDTPERFFTSTEGMVRLDQDLTEVPGAVIAGFNVRKVPPTYPERAQARHIAGAVVLNALIGTDGRIHHLTLQSSPDPDLALAAFVAVRKWTYKPYLLKGRPTQVTTTITVNFNLSRG